MTDHPDASPHDGPLSDDRPERSQPPPPGQAPDRRPPLDPSGLLREIRSRLGLSQRELARKAGVPHSTVSRTEARTMQPTLPTLERLLVVGGIALVAVDGEYRIVEPMLDVPEGGLLDGAERRYPAHYGVIVQPRAGEWWGGKYGLARPPETYHRSRGYREAQRSYSQWDTRHFRTRHRPLTLDEWLRRHPEERDPGPR